ncbi:MAG: hypothetical protein LQ343_006183 [Gyalolechia ehrenbergii]|nr:MAG: hypothetical protein LQ343_006183 [Gyalolechia ehrenbergii]
MSPKYNNFELRANAYAQHPVSNIEGTKNHRKQNVTVHNMMRATPPEDWTLYPEEVVRSKHSSVKEQKGTSQKSRSNLKNGVFTAAGPKIPPTPPGSNPASVEDKRTVQRTNACTQIAAQSLQGPPTFGASDPPAMADKRIQRHVSYPHRLPTPDISDVDEDEFWACCKDSSKKN